MIRTLDNKLSISSCSLSKPITFSSPKTGSATGSKADVIERRSVSRGSNVASRASWILSRIVLAGLSAR